MVVSPNNASKNLKRMLVKRLQVILLLIPVAALFIALGGWPFALLIVTMLGIAAFEYSRIFTNGQFNPARILIIAGVILLVIQRQVSGFLGSDLLLALLVLVAMALFVFRYERGHNTSAVDFGISLAGILYLGWLGGYFISLRNLPDGEWWMVVILPAVWLADAGAFVIGRRWGRHPFSPRVSPKKTWEGYVGGIVIAAAGTSLLAALWNLRAPTITPLHGLIIGLVISIITPLGDLGESMLKRPFGVKDSGKLLPGHGGVLDRIDSWLWACTIGFYLVQLFMR
jgi:phosphatidate cytidylyltransferase